MPELIPPRFARLSEKRVKHMWNIFPSAEETIKYLLKTVKAKDTVATIGAGSIYKIGEAFIKQLVARETKK